MYGAFLLPKKEMTMLTIRSKSISLSGDSTVNDQVVFAYQASINSNNPKEVQFSNVPQREFLFFNQIRK